MRPTEMDALLAKLIASQDNMEQFEAVADSAERAYLGSGVFPNRFSFVQIRALPFVTGV
jgi:hypothetical protein